MVELKPIYRRIGLDLARQAREDAELLGRYVDGAVHPATIEELAARLAGERLHLFSHLLGASCTGPEIGPIQDCCTQLSLAFQTLSQFPLEVQLERIRKLTWSLAEQLMLLGPDH